MFIIIEAEFFIIPTISAILHNNYLSRLLILIAHTPTFLTNVLGDNDLICPHIHMAIFLSYQYSFSVFPQISRN